MPAASMESADYPLSRIPILLAKYLKQAKLHHKETQHDIASQGTFTYYMR